MEDFTRERSLFLLFFKVFGLDRLDKGMELLDIILVQNMVLFDDERVRFLFEHILFDIDWRILTDCKIDRITWTRVKVDQVSIVAQIEPYEERFVLHTRSEHMINVGIQVRERIEEHIMGNRTRKTNVLDGEPHLRCFGKPDPDGKHTTRILNRLIAIRAQHKHRRRNGLRDDERLYIATNHEVLLIPVCLLVYLHLRCFFLMKGREP